MAVITGTTGDDILDGTTGVDLIIGDSGNDIITGGLGDDILYGDDGDDIFRVHETSGYDSYHGGDGTDLIVVDNVPNYVNYVDLQLNYMDSIEGIINNSNVDTFIVARGSQDFSNTALIDIAGIKGSDGEDYITAHTIYNSATSTTTGVHMWGYDGDDELLGTNLADVIDGGVGDDTIAGGGGDDDLSGAEGADTIDGGNGNDLLSGGDGNDTLAGRAGADTLNGGDGDDILLGGAGDDTLTGGNGTDLFWFEQSEGWDVVTDFEDGVDYIVVGSSITNVTLYNYGGDALLGFDDATAGATYVQLAGIDPSQISGADLLFA
jgi:Ca2+-binding RTX toxin-like protein